MVTLPDITLRDHTFFCPRFKKIYEDYKPEFVYWKLVSCLAQHLLPAVHVVLCMRVLTLPSKPCAISPSPSPQVLLTRKLCLAFIVVMVNHNIRARKLAGCIVSSQRIAQFAWSGHCLCPLHYCVVVSPAADCLIPTPQAKIGWPQHVFCFVCMRVSLPFPFLCDPEASLSVFLLFIAYILQQRYAPFVSASSLSKGLDLSQAEVESRLSQRKASTLTAKAPVGGGILRKRSTSMPHAIGCLAPRLPLCAHGSGGGCAVVSSLTHAPPLSHALSST